MSTFSYDLTGRRIFIAGHRGIVGSALERRLASENCTVLVADRDELDLTKQGPTLRWLEINRPDVVLHAAAKVGGIAANNTFPVDLLCDNLSVELNVIRASHEIGVRRLLFLGSSCIYPKHAKPIVESDLMAGQFEPTNEWYAVAKIAGLKMCQAYRRQYGDDFISVMPTNLYGRGDNYHPDHSHVAAARIRRFHEAKLAHSAATVVLGTGAPLREFLSVEDLADACVFLLKTYSSDMPINVGSDDELSIADFSAIIAETVEYQGRVVVDPSKPDGTPRKLLDSSRIRSLGWSSRVSLGAGLRAAYDDFLQGCGRHLEVDAAG